ncbi:uncharacterized protein BDZ99DRAFT_526061 [Mytilinidion resinicola]|uniref:Mediator of RNA polymerase II transcription subunit 22 n=1 Tax=Mytilinidion resinicola TaxID=574789 RepID=A0A6A6Y5T3_9PEZI|nr:uncharacterized protein BDZ99DRAFT_526061 [Mytilinidion resinicola]KAF2804020.1 hypothetical protein BDZ99DRAFT_526061 [Mytilinidion resinicola]
MDSNLRNTAAMKAHILKLQTSLVSRFENLVATAALESTDYNTTSVNALHMKEESAALVRAAEDLLGLTRQMQELWLFGTLDTLKLREEQQGGGGAEGVAGAVEGWVKAEERAAET